ncbi:MAG: hypothetical protein Q4B43_07315 [Bacteroidota bacterium]|nr:hypothetical protein [Bacteroidota bacterium]
MIKNKMPSTELVRNVRILVDQTTFDKTDKLIEKLIALGFRKETIKAMVLTKEKNYTNTSNIAFFRESDIKTSKRTNNGEINFFFENKIDLLINYYNDDNLLLKFMTALAEADFNVGFAFEKNNMNHLAIDVKTEDFSLFATEMVKYLKIIKKI